MKNNKLHSIITYSFSLIPLIAILVMYNKIGEKIPVHWDWEWKIDAWADKNTLFILAIVPIAFTFLMAVLPKIDPKKENYKRFEGTYNTICLLFSIFFCILIFITIFSAMGQDFSGKLLMAVMGAIFCVLGNFMPKFKQNYFIGIKTPWTLASEAVWQKTHRLGGLMWFVGGILIIILSFFSHRILNTILPIIILSIFAITPIVYSYFAFKKQK